MHSVGNAVILKEEETCLDNYQGEELLTHKVQGNTEARSMTNRCRRCYRISTSGMDLFETVVP